MAGMQTDFYQAAYPRQLPSALESVKAGFSAHTFSDTAWTPVLTPGSLQFKFLPTKNP